MTLQQLKYVIAVADAGSMNQAAKELFVAQSGLSAAIRELEEELGFSVFDRTNRGISVTRQGEEFLGYARQVAEQYRLLEERFVEKQVAKQHFSVSTQHYSFAVKAFVETVREFGMEKYEFAIHETKTYDVISDVRSGKSEIGILFLDDFNSKVLNKILEESGTEFHPLFLCRTFVYLWKGHPLAGQKQIAFEQLQDYPCLAFDQGSNNSFYFAEEVLSTSSYRRMIRVNDRATMLNLMMGLNGYTLCSGIICEELNGSEYSAVPLDSDEVMHIGYITRKKAGISSMGKKYIEELQKYGDRVLPGS